MWKGSPAWTDAPRQRRTPGSRSDRPDRPRAASFRATDRGRCDGQIEIPAFGDKVACGQLIPGVQSVAELAPGESS